MNKFLLIPLQIFSYDVWFYISHVFLHYKTPFTLIHYIHHQKPHNKLILWDAYVGSNWEGIIQSAGIFIPYLLNRFPLPYLFIAGFLTNLRGLIRHDNRYIWLIGNHHLLHHKYPNYNYGEYWIDKLCGTLYPNADEYEYGLIYT